ncbi:YrhB domain-containing protein [Variovorax boronicumulans]|uniref:YrhB domain-containing protein n=1 Tax=Variovorax boronicumulans TaxID=436515 RepID=UPI000BB315BC|nr:YrhB domain-containing protein [Variovorax boronicumulans]
MITKEKARQLVAESVCGSVDWFPDDDELILLDEQTLEKPWGWVFFYTSKKWHETREVRYAIAGNAPILVERRTGKLIATGTAMPIERYIENFERTGSPHG